MKIPISRIEIFIKEKKTIFDLFEKIAHIFNFKTNYTGIEE